MSFCSKCGKETPDGVFLCDECASTTPKAAETHNDASEEADNLVRIMHTATPRDMAFAALLILPSLLLINSLLWSGVGLGLTVAIILIAVFSFAYAITEKKALPSLYSTVLAAIMILSAISLTISDEPITKGFSVAAIFILYMVVLTDYFGARSRKEGSYRAAMDIAETAFARGLGKMDNGLFALFRKTDEEGNIEKRKTGKVITGALVALPVLFLVVPLLILSDAAFEGIFKKFTFDSIWEIFLSVSLGFLYFLAVFSRLFTMKTAEPAEKKESNPAGLDPISVGAFLSVISFVYIVYLFSQLAYFFSAFSGLLPEDFSLSEYARRGFFEMSVVCAINLFIVFLATVLCKKTEKGLPPAIKALCLFLCGFSCILIGTAISKMFLYIDRLGLTRLRVYTSVFMVFLALVFLTVILKLFICRIPYMKIILVSACSILLVTCLADADRIIANYNVNAYLSGKHQSVDIATIEKLDSSAIAPLLWLSREGDEATKDEARSALTNHLKKHYDIIQDDDGNVKLRRKDFDIRNLNISRELALDLLEENWEDFIDYDIYYNRAKNNYAY